jgi:TrmH family RNA methyltransferase
MITSRQNRRIKDIRALRRSKGDRVLLEGPHLVAEAVAAGLALEEVLAAPGFFESSAEGAELRRVLAALPEPPLEVAPDVLAALADADAPKGLLAVARLPRGGVESLPVVPDGVYLFLEGLQDPGNLGAVARSAEAAGAVGLALAPGCAHPNHPRALRGSAGSLLRLPAAVGVEAGALDERLRAGLPGPPRWAALVPRNGEVPWDADLSGPLVLAVGAEGPGLSDDLLARADLRLTIPLAPPVESLNAAVAAALVLFEIRRRRSGAGRAGSGPAAG